MYLHFFKKIGNTYSLTKLIHSKNNTLINYSLYLTMRTIRTIIAINKLLENERKVVLEISTKKIFDCYLNNLELTACSSLDCGDFALTIVD